MKIWVLLLLLCSVDAFAQRLPFYGSLREPSSYTKLFGGVSAAVSYSIDNTAIPILENQLLCCKFERGATTVLSVGGSAEYWLSPQWSFGSTVGLSQMMTSLSQEADPIPRRDKSPLVTEYNGSISSFAITAQSQSKYRFYGTNFSVGGAVAVAVPFAQSTKLIERDVSENAGSNPLFSEKTLVGFNQTYQSLILEPSVFVGYDFAIKNGNYLQTTFHSGYRPSVLKNQDYSSLFFRLNCAYLFAL